MPIPAQVQAQADAADVKLKELGNPNPPPVEPAKKPEYQNPKPPEKGTAEDWKHKFEVLQGKYNSEIQAVKGDVQLLNTLKNQVRQLTAQNADLQRLVEDVNKKLAEKPKEEKPAAQLPDSFAAVLSDEDREHLEAEGFESKTIEIIGKLARGLSGNAGPSREIEDLKKDIQATKEDKFWEALNKGKGVEDWREVNSSDWFNDWLDLPLPYSNVARRQRLADAQASLDYVTVIQMFKDAKAEAGAKAKPKEEQEPRIDPAKQIEPESSVVHQPPAGDQPAGKTYTRAEITRFYSEAAVELSKSSTSKDRREELARIDADILKAQKEGRIK